MNKRKNSVSYTIGGQTGMATVLALLLVGLLTIIGIIAMSTSDDEVQIAGNELHELKAFYASEAGLEKAASVIEYTYETTGIPPSILPSGTDSYNNCAVKYSTTDDGPIKQKRISSGSLTGLIGLVKSYTITSLASDQVDHASIEMSQSFEAVLVPLFQFAVFYDNDLEIAPGFDMTIGGRLHTNGDLWVDASTKLLFDGKVTSAGSIYHGRLDGTGAANGDVYFKHATGLYQDMFDGTNWLDASDPDWYTSAQTRWGGNVQDQAFGHPEFNLPLSGSDDPHSIIERASTSVDSYENKATFKIIDGVPLAKIGGLWQNVSGFLPAGTITNTTFYDAREGQTVNTTEIDMSLLNGSGYFPTNGVLYTSDQRYGFNGTRLTNGEEIARPLSVFSENPVYVQGDFNTKNKKGVAVVSDALTFLSNSWDDSKSALALKDRGASSTIVNLSFIAGNSATDGTTYGGGLENFPRFLENWSSQTFSFRGSMNSLWDSRQAKGLWSYGDYYTAPKRDWGFDKDLEDPTNLPPETPSLQIFQRTGWVQKYVGFVQIDTAYVPLVN